MWSVREVDLWYDWRTGCVKGGDAKERTQAKHAEIGLKELDEVLWLQLPNASRDTVRLRLSFHPQGKNEQFNTTRSHLTDYSHDLQSHRAKTTKEEHVDHKNSWDKEQPASKIIPNPTQKTKTPQVKKYLEAEVTLTKDPQVSAEEVESILIFNIL